MVVVGDTPRDVACARAGGALCIGVTTGIHDAAALAGADVVVPSLEEAGEVLEGWTVSELWAFRSSGFSEL